MNASALQKKLSDFSDTGPVDRLSQICVNSLLKSNAGQLVSTSKATALTVEALQSWLDSETALPVLERQIEWLNAELQAERRTLGELTDPSLKAALKELVSRPFSPDKKLVLTIIDRKPVRELVRQLLTETLLDFGKRASAPVAGVARGLGSLARMAGESVKARSGGFGSLVGAVSGEVERQLEKRTVEFVDSALAGIFGKIADAVSNPARAHEAAELRLAMFEGVLELTPVQLSRELINADVPGGAAVLRDALKRALKTENTQARIGGVIEKLISREGSKTVADALNEVGLLEVCRRELTLFVRTQLQAVFTSNEFETWLKDVMTET